MNRLVKAYLKAFGRAHTYDPRGNPYLWFGFLWGLPVPLFAIAFDVWLGVPGRGLAEVLLTHPVQLFFLLHPVFFAVVFGAMGTLRHDLEVENARLIDELRGLATTDPLTGLPNRRRVMEELETTLARSARTRESFVVAMFDLDGFKQINDERGHPEGDLILKKTAAALSGVVRQGDVLGRYGGDEFLLVAHGATALEGAMLQRTMEAVKRESGLSISAGVARYPRDGGTSAGLIATADARLYEVKRTTKTRRRDSA